MSRQSISMGIMAVMGSCTCVSAATIESEYVRVTANEAGQYAILDKQTGVEWASNPYVDRLGTVALGSGETSVRRDLNQFKISGGGNTLKLSHVVGDGIGSVEITFTILPDGKTVDLAYRTTGETGIRSIALLDEAMWVTDADKGYAVVPAKVGAIMRADVERASTAQLYEDLEMWMLGLVKKGSALLITWDVPYVRPILTRKLTDPPHHPSKQVLSTTLTLRGAARSVRLHFLGDGDYMTIAQAYRSVAREKGLRVTWDAKLRENGEIKKLFGAACFRIPRLMERIKDREGGERATMKVSFAEAVRIAEHLKYDVKLDKVLMIMPGWIRWGYDNQHPDILPAAPECGGNAGLAEASRRIQKLGYLFCPHDNYQDVYRDAPSWSEGLVRKNAEGNLVAGGWWEGGQAYIACSQKSVELARRNLPEVKRLFDPNAYFIDTTFCVDLDECHDLQHPLTKVTDLAYRAEMCDYARGLFGVFGSEDGKEWAIPHSDFFEGLSCISGYAGNKAGVLPFFEMVYHDCIVVYGKYGYDINQAAGYLLHQLRQGMPLNYHFEPPHLYWLQPEASHTPVEVQGGWDQPASCMCRADNGWAEGMCRMDVFLKNTYEVTNPLHEITARMLITNHQFLNKEMTAQRVVFGDEVDVIINETGESFAYRSKYGGDITLPTYGFLVESPTYIAFHSLSWNSRSYGQAVLFTIRSLDGQSIPVSDKVRVYHGFGDARLRLGGQTFTVKREVVLTGLLL